MVQLIGLSSEELSILNMMYQLRGGRNTTYLEIREMAKAVWPNLDEDGVLSSLVESGLLEKTPYDHILTKKGKARVQSALTLDLVRLVNSLANLPVLGNKVLRNLEKRLKKTDDEPANENKDSLGGAHPNDIEWPKAA